MWGSWAEARARGLGHEKKKADEWVVRLEKK
jgi:hypothetical protein